MKKGEMEGAENEEMEEKLKRKEGRKRRNGGGRKEGEMYRRKWRRGRRNWIKKGRRRTN
jgi:hypothetical protein